MSVTKMAGICSLNPTTLMTILGNKARDPPFNLFILSKFQFSSWISLFFLANWLALILQRIHGIRCCSGATDNENKSQTRTKTPHILKLALSGVTELLRVFSFSGKERYLPYYSPSSIAFSGCFLGRCPGTKQNRVLFLVMRCNFRGFLGIMLWSETIFNQILISNYSMMCYIVDEVYKILLALLGIQSSFPLLFVQVPSCIRAIWICRFLSLIVHQLDYKTLRR